MPGRKVTFFNEQYYHIFNRGIEKRKIFLNTPDYKHARSTLWFYQKNHLPLSLSHFYRLSSDLKFAIGNNIAKLPNRLEVIAFCFMPNHVHFLIKQNVNNGISAFMSDFQNSYTRYFNKKNKRKGHLFEGQFKAVRIESDNQLLHTSRYIHLNPTTSFLVNETQLLDYEWSSLPEYVDEKNLQKCTKDIILSNFNNRIDYKNFVFDQIDYQQQLKEIEHLLLEEL